MSLLALIAGILIGTSVGTGLFPAFKQPKNFRIQLSTGIFGLLIGFFVIFMSTIK